MRLLFVSNWYLMNDSKHLATWVTRETKERFAAAARLQGMSDSALLQRLVTLMLQTANAGDIPSVADDNRPVRDARLTIRLRAEDQLLLHERAAARGMPSATYVSVLTRAHLRKLTPLPKAELIALKRAVSEVGSIGRNLNQIARAAHQGARIAGPSSGAAVGLTTRLRGAQRTLQGTVSRQPQKLGARLCRIARSMSRYLNSSATAAVVPAKGTD